MLKKKLNADGSLDRYKARLVAQGFSQRPGWDYTECFSPTYRIAALRLILALSAFEDLELRSVDISNAFLHGVLEEEIYMKQPEGFQQGPKDYVLPLAKAIYGLKQGGRQWNKVLHKVLISLGFKRLESDRAIYVYAKDDVRIIVPVFVDDITMASKSKAKLDEMVALLAKHFKLRDLGETKWLLGIEITRDHPNRAVALDQRQYIADLLERFQMSQCKPVTTPMEAGLYLEAASDPLPQADRVEMAKVPYLSAVGALMYLAIMTRPDISYAVGYFARFSANPSPTHWKHLKRIFRYLQHTKDLKLVYRPTSSKDVFSGYSDADHGGDKATGRSTGGYCMKVGSGMTSWSSKLQPLVSLSTTQAEFTAAVEAGKEIMWLRNLLGELGYDQSGATTLHMDNQSAISVSKNPEHFGRMKHLDLRMFWLREVVEAGQIKPEFIPTSSMPADILTKPLSRDKFEAGRKMLGLEDSLG